MWVEGTGLWSWWFGRHLGKYAIVKYSECALSKADNEGKHEYVVYVKFV